MFDFIFTLIVNMVGDFFDKKFLTLKYGIRFLLFLNSLILGAVLVFSFTLNQQFAIVLIPNMLFLCLIVIVKLIINK